MPPTNPLEILLTHDHWATLQLLDACEKLTPDQFAQKFDLGPGSLQATITHMIAAINAWCDTLSRRPHRPRIDQGNNHFTPQELRPLLESAAAELTQLAEAEPIDNTVTRSREGREYTFTRGIVITHVTTHGMHHRAQCLNMLKQLGIKPLPLSSVVEWSRTVGLP